MEALEVECDELMVEKYCESIGGQVMEDFRDWSPLSLTNPQLFLKFKHITIETKVPVLSANGGQYLVQKVNLTP